MDVSVRDETADPTHDGRRGPADETPQPPATTLKTNAAFGMSAASAEAGPEGAVAGALGPDQKANVPRDDDAASGWDSDADLEALLLSSDPAPLSSSSQSLDTIMATRARELQLLSATNGDERNRTAAAAAAAAASAYASPENVEDPSKPPLLPSSQEEHDRRQLEAEEEEKEKAPRTFKTSLIYGGGGGAAATIQPAPSEKSAMEAVASCGRALLFFTDPEFGACRRMQGLLEELVSVLSGGGGGGGGATWASSLSSVSSSSYYREDDYDDYEDDDDDDDDDEDSHGPLRVISLRARDAEWLARRLGVRVLPCLIGYVDGAQRGKIVGFEGLAPSLPPSSSSPAAAAASADGAACSVGDLARAMARWKVFGTRELRTLRRRTRTRTRNLPGAVGRGEKGAGKRGIFGAAKSSAAARRRAGRDEEEDDDDDWD